MHMISLLEKAEIKKLVKKYSLIEKYLTINRISDYIILHISSCLLLNLYSDLAS